MNRSASILCLLSLLAARAPALASEHAGPTLRLRAAGITAGAAVLLEPADGSATSFVSAGATLAAQPIGSSAGATFEVAAGPWPILTIEPATPLPEPATSLSLLAGGSLLAWLARRRGRRHA